MPEQNNGLRIVWSLVVGAAIAGAGLTTTIVDSGTARGQVQLAQETKMEMEMATEGLFEGRGEVIALVPDKTQIVVGHEEIKGFMKAMPMGMGYDLESAALLTGLQPGDQITFTMDAATKKIIKIEATAN